MIFTANERVVINIYLFNSQVMTLLKKQTDMIKATQHANAAGKSTTGRTNAPAASPEASKTISAKAIQANKRTANLPSTATNLQDDRDLNRSIDTDDGDSRDEDLVIDMKEYEAEESKSKENEPENDKCKCTD